MADSACECERSQDANLAQSLHLLNSSDIQKKISDGSGRAASLAKDEKRSHAEKITELYYWAFSRSPDAEEMKLASAYVEKAEKKQLAYEDIVWALINTKEFLFSLSNSERQVLKQVDEALSRIEDRCYGVCA